MAAAASRTAANFGALARLFGCATAQPLAGTKAVWKGRGFSFIELPKASGVGRPAARLLFHKTNEKWVFEAVGGAVANRTFRQPKTPNQPDQFTFAVMYSQSVNAEANDTVLKDIADPNAKPDLDTMSGGIHAEKGFLIFDPSETEYADSNGSNTVSSVDGQQYVRLGTIPHGVSIMLSTAVNGGAPTISTLDDMRAVFRSFKPTPIDVGIGPSPRCAVCSAV